MRCNSGLRPHRDVHGVVGGGDAVIPRRTRPALLSPARMTAGDCPAVHSMHATKPISHVYMGTFLLLVSNVANVPGTGGQRWCENVSTGRTLWDDVPRPWRA